MGKLRALVGIAMTLGATISFASAPGVAAATPAGSATLTQVIDGCTIVVHPTKHSFTNCPGANLVGIVLNRTDLDWANLSQADLDHASLVGSSLVDADLVSTSLQKADLALATLSSADLSYSDFTGANLSNATFDSALLIKVTFKRADIEGAVLGLVSTLEFSNSGGVVGNPASLPNGWTLDNGYLVGPTADLRKAQLPSVTLDNQNVGSTNLTRANLADASLQDVNFRRSTLMSANLSGSDFTGSNLTKANLSGATVERTNFTDVVWSDTTCPDGTNSDSDGATCVNNFG